jgi:hypothetical protein
MNQAKFAMGQKVWALRGEGRWGEPTGVRGTIIGIQQSLTAGSYLYTIKKDVFHSDNIIEVWEGSLSSMNED